jgi:hypothetical protein
MKKQIFDKEMNLRDELLMEINNVTITYGWKLNMVERTVGVL